MFELKSYEKNGFIIVELSGELDSSSVPEFLSKLKKIWECKAKKIILDMKNMEFISSSGWSAIIEECKKLRAASGDMKIACLNKKMKRIFDVVGINVLIKYYESIEDATKD